MFVTVESRGKVHCLWAFVFFFFNLKFKWISVLSYPPFIPSLVCTPSCFFFFFIKKKNDNFFFFYHFSVLETAPRARSELRTKTVLVIRPSKVLPLIVWWNWSLSGLAPVELCTPSLPKCIQIDLRFFRNLFLFLPHVLFLFVVLTPTAAELARSSSFSPTKKACAGLCCCSVDLCFIWRGYKFIFFLSLTTRVPPPPPPPPPHPASTHTR